MECVIERQLPNNSSRCVNFVSNIGWFGRN